MAIIRKPYRESSTGMVNIRNPIFSAALYQTTGDSVKYPVSNPLLKRKKELSGNKLERYNSSGF